MTAVHPVILDVEFRELNDFPGYAVSSDGHAWSCLPFSSGKGVDKNWHVLKPQLRKCYCRVGLWRNRKLYWRSVHSLILNTFVGICPQGMEACHFPDPNRTNNRLDNLRWDTQQANIDDAVILGRIPRGIRKPDAKLTDEDIPNIRELISNGVSKREVARMFGVSHTVINAISKGTLWKHIP